MALSYRSNASDLDPVSCLADFILENQPLMILTGAGCSTASGIPDYRDRNGNWKHQRPVMYTEFIRDEETRKRYWSRSMYGWPRISTASPNAAHLGLGRMESAGYVQSLVTQNVDGLHQRAGSSTCLELHGGLQWVSCLECRYRVKRSVIQDWLTGMNGELKPDNTSSLPDGDFDPGVVDLNAFQIPSCPSCNGILKPDVVFFGETVPASRVAQATHQLENAAGLLVAGSSLMVFSGYRFCRMARKLHKPVAILNLGNTRADDMAQLKLEASCTVLAGVSEQLSCPVSVS